MSSIFAQNLLAILNEELDGVEQNIAMEVNPKFLDEKGKTWLQEIFEELGGKGPFPQLEKVKFDAKINRMVILVDFELNFNRYRLKTFRSELYDNFQFPFVEAHKRLCRTFEKECMKAGFQGRHWNGPPVARQWFGDSEEIGDFSGNGSAGWKLRAYNDAQIDLLSRIHGFKLIRISPFETLMTGGALRRLDQLLMNPKEEQQKVVSSWLLRKLEIEAEKKNQS